MIAKQQVGADYSGPILCEVDFPKAILIFQNLLVGCGMGLGHHLVTIWELYHP